MYAIRDRWFGNPLGHIKIIKKFQQKLGEISLEDVKKGRIQQPRRVP
jgi:hypothetical protein